jgi:hypothetical protein
VFASIPTLSVLHCMGVGLFTGGTLSEKELCFSGGFSLNTRRVQGDRVTDSMERNASRFGVSAGFVAS